MVQKLRGQYLCSITDHLTGSKFKARVIEKGSFTFEVLKLFGKNTK